MKPYRIVTFLAAVLVTAFFAGIFGHEEVGTPEQQSGFIQ